MRIDAPAPGVALLFAFGPVALAHLYLFGEARRGTADEWRDWMAVPSAG